ncbi:TPA: N-acetylglucosamine-6-phosphate deacetylase [Candidatus Acetothermia bacterium]|nr:N-acetylglucosamine-6-phosphate deacetylase [Candidatus Acetothermia bacterium]
MNNLLVRAARLVTPTGIREGDCLIVAGRIAALGTVQAPPGVPVLEGEGRYLAPGFLDLHAHGASGADFSEGEPEAVQQIVRFHAMHGTTGLLATIVPGLQAKVRRAMETASAARGILGIHLEGPYLAPDKCGALDPRWFLPPDREAFRALVRGCEKMVKVVTFSPELPGAVGLVAEILRMGAVPAIGHTAATYDQAQAALERGARHVTHLGNAMSGLHHREPGAVGAALTSAATLELIADGVHVHPAVVRLVVDLLRGRGELHRLCLVSDATAAGMADGIHPWAGGEIHVAAGAARRADGTLAGSTLTLDRAVRNAARFGNLTLEEALRFVTANPARVLGLEGTAGALAPGAAGDVVLLDANVVVTTTIRAGEILFSTPTGPTAESSRPSDVADCRSNPPRR